MLKWLIAGILLTALLASAQVPDPAPVNVERLIKLIGEKEVQIAQMRDYIAALQARITQLQDENAKLAKPAGQP